MLLKMTSRIVVGLIFSLALYANEVSAQYSLLVFGDSLSDTGAGRSVCESLGLPSLPPLSHYYQGRYCNGPIWIDHLSADLQLEYLNFSVGGAQSGEGQTLQVFGYPLGGLFHQIDRFQSVKNQVDPNAIVILEIGSNDFLSLLLTPSLLTPEGIAERTEQAVRNIATACYRLQSLGAKKMILWNIPDLGRIPKFSHPPLNAAVPLITAAVNQLNGALSNFVENFNRSNPQMQLFYYDANKALTEISVSLAANGTDLSAHTVTLCFHLPPVVLPTVQVTGPAPDGLFFYDQDHPTSAVWQVFAERFREFLVPLLTPSQQLAHLQG